MFRRARLVFALLAVFCLLSSAPVYAGEGGEPTRSRGTATERLDLRSPNAKVFQFADGSGYAQVYSVPIHFRSNDGSWQPINTQLTPLSGGGWATKASDVAVRFQARSVQRTRTQLSAPHTPLVSITQDSRTLQFEPLDASSSTAQVAGSEITYPNIYEDVDLQYETAPGMVKEALVLHKLPAQQSFRFVMRVTGVTPHLDANGGIALDPCAETCWTILPPFMEDAGGATSDAVQVAMQDLGGGSYELTYTPDAVWLANSTRAWPVVLDPTVNTSGGVSTYVQEGYPNIVSYNQRYSAVGYDPEGTGKARTRSFFAVSMPGLPANSSITNATFYFYQYYRSSAATGYTGEIRRVTSDWVGNLTNITWNTNQPNVDGSVASSRFVDTAIGWKDWNVTGLVQQWYSGTPNYGLSVWASPETTRGSYFCSMSAGGTLCGTPDASQVKPYFRIDYQVNNLLPNPPTLVAPANDATVGNTVTLQVQDAGDPDNGPRNFRDFFFRIEKTDNSWAQESGWRDANWGITLPSAGSYRWRAMAGDGAAGSAWSGWWTINFPAPPTGRTLDVRYVDQVYVQQKTEGGYWNHCGPASTAMLFHYEGKEKRDVLYDKQATLDLVCPLKIDCKGATYVGRNLLAIQQRGLATSTDWSLTFEDIRQSIDRGHPVVMGIKQANHVVLAIGYGPNNTVIINDPFGGKGWWGNFALANSTGATLAQPQLKGKNISYAFGSELTSSYGFIVSGPAPVPVQTRASITSTQGGTLVGQGATFTFAASATRAATNSDALDLTHTPLIAPSHSGDIGALALSSFTLEASSAGQPISTATQPFAMQIALDPEVIDIWGQEIGETSGETASISRSSFSGRTNDVEKQNLSQRIIIAAWNGTTGQWIPLDTTVDLANYQVRAQSNQFTEFAVFVKPEYTTYLPLLQR